MIYYIAIIDNGYGHEDGFYGVVFPDLLGCTAMGKTRKKAIKNAKGALNDWVREMVSQGWDIPDPSGINSILSSREIRRELERGSHIIYVPLDPKYHCELMDPEPAHPGISLREKVIQEFNISVIKLSKLMGMKNFEVMTVLSGKSPITERFAREFCRIVGGRPQDLMELQREYDQAMKERSRK